MCHEFWEGAGFARPCRQRALSAGCVPWEHFQPSSRLSARSSSSTYMRADKKHCLPEPGFKNDDPASSRACVGQTPLPLGVLHSSCFRERSGGLFCSLLCQRRMEQAFKRWASSLHKRLWAKQSRDEQGHGLLGPSGHLLATKANQSWPATFCGSGGAGGGGEEREVRCHGDGSAPAPEASAGDPRCKVRFLKKAEEENSERIHTGS